MEILRMAAEADPAQTQEKLDLSIDANGLARIEKQSFDAYNESDVLIGAIERYHERTGHYPERVLVDKIYRNRKNLSFCKEHGIRITGPALGRPKKNILPEEKRQAYEDAVIILIRLNKAAPENIDYSTFSGSPRAMVAFCFFTVSFSAIPEPSPSW